MSSIIDYSKWDKMDYGSSDDEDGDGDDEDDEPLCDSEGSQQHDHQADAVLGRLRVSKLDQPCTVTRTANGKVIVGNAPRESTKKLKIAAAPCPSAVSSEPNDENSHKANITATTDMTIPDSWTEKGSYEVIQSCKLYWCQDRYSATLRIALPTADSKWTCSVSNLLSYDDRYTAVGSTPKAELVVTRADMVKDVFLHGEVAYPVHAAHDEEGVDWSIESHAGERFMLITFNKATPMAGMTLWWTRPLLEMKEISMEWREQASTGFQKAWNEAHSQFIDKKRSEAR